ncbi:MAG: hypothetical protein VYA84_19945 [Planctomycetota bacterium]|nr:hypothetical protein [Planctomycetota bacterium]
MKYLASCGCLLSLLGCVNAAAQSSGFSLNRFERQQLTDTYFSEGANAGDSNGDGVADVVCSPFSFEGPQLETEHKIYQPVPQDRNRYADNFFSWLYDFNGDSWNDVLVVVFPGTPASVFGNPGTDGFAVLAGKWTSTKLSLEVTMFRDISKAKSVSICTI